MDKTQDQLIRLGGSISWEEREEMVKEYFTGHYTKAEIWEKYTGQKKDHGQLLRWMRALGYVADKKPFARRQVFLHSSIQTYQNMDTSENNTDPLLLQKRIKELEKQLETAQLKAEGYELMIEIAEKELKIPIRKKSSTK